jgi:threonyl-tRNA synthetase
VRKNYIRKDKFNLLTYVIFILKEAFVLAGVNMKIAIKDNIVAEVEKGTTVGSVAESISKTLAKNIICGKINDKLVDLDDSIGKNCKLELITIKDDEAINILNESASHILAQAVKTIYPSAKLGFGGVNENGFYYDFEFKTEITENDLSTIEDEIKRIVKAGFKLSNKKMSVEDAIIAMSNSEEHY